MLLKDFSYYFSVKGGKGGIYSLDFELLPDVPVADEAGLESVKQTVVENFSQLESLLDELLLENQDFAVEKTPTLTDGPHSLTAGYEYEGQTKFSKTTFSFLKTLVSFLVPASTPATSDTDEGEVERFRTISSRLSYSFEKRRTDDYPAKIVMRVSLGHNLNFSMLKQVLELPGLTISQKAEQEIKHLQQMASKRKDLDPAGLLDASSFHEKLRD